MSFLTPKVDEEEDDDGCSSSVSPGRLGMLALSPLRFRVEGLADGAHER
jgi:hypothetical protein